MGRATDSGTGNGQWDGQRAEYDRKEQAENEAGTNDRLDENGACRGQYVVGRHGGKRHGGGRHVSTAEGGTPAAPQRDGKENSKGTAKAEAAVRAPGKIYRSALLSGQQIMLIFAPTTTNRTHP